MSPDTAHAHHVFVDFENVPSVDLNLVGALPVLVTLLIGRTQTRLDTTLVEQIHAHAAKVRLITLGASGRNALDLTLAYYLGRAVAENADAELHIVSKDKDFEPLIAHLRSKNIPVARSDSFAALPFLAGAKQAPGAKRAATPRKPRAHAVAPVEDDRVARLTARLRDAGNRSRPSRETRLLAHIRTMLGKEATEEKARDVLLRLQEQQVLAIEPGGKVVYPDAG
jgi:hypothetical protein